MPSIDQSRRKKLKLLCNIKWNCYAYSLKSHVSDHNKDRDGLLECPVHIEFTVHRPEQRVECLFDSIDCTDSTLQVAAGLLRAITKNMREDFEDKSTSLIEVDPYRRSSHSASHNANVSSVDFKTGHGPSGVELRWHHKDDFLKLS